MEKDIEFIDPTDQRSANLFVRVEHLARYLYASEFVRKRRLKRVLDAACGNGYGSRILAVQAAFVEGADRSEAYIAQGQSLNKSLSIHNLVYHTADLNAGLPMLTEGSFDCATCFETLEHIENEENLLSDLKRVLRRGSWLLLSVPKAGYEPVGDDGLPVNRYHFRLYEEPELTAKLNRWGFAVEQVLGQPYTNVSRANMESFRRDKGITYEDISSYFVETLQSMEFFAKVWGWPTKEAPDRSNVLFLICRRT
jgi:2-polyprenyl-3-methyl-5-hydroxy-6-metoxy-1,4-benzoquinol methylase